MKLEFRTRFMWELLVIVQISDYTSYPKNEFSAKGQICLHMHRLADSVYSFPPFMHVTKGDNLRHSDNVAIVLSPAILI